MLVQGTGVVNRCRGLREARIGVGMASDPVAHAPSSVDHFGIANGDAQGSERTECGENIESSRFAKEHFAASTRTCVAKRIDLPERIDSGSEPPCSQGQAWEQPCTYTGIHGGEVVARGESDGLDVGVVREVSGERSVVALAGQRSVGEALGDGQGQGSVGEHAAGVEGPGVGHQAIWSENVCLEQQVGSSDKPVECEGYHWDEPLGACSQFPFGWCLFECQQGGACVAEEPCRCGGFFFGSCGGGRTGDGLRDQPSCGGVQRGQSGFDGFECVGSEVLFSGCDGETEKYSATGLEPWAQHSSELSIATEQTGRIGLMVSEKLVEIEWEGLVDGAVAHASSEGWTTGRGIGKRGVETGVFGGGCDLAAGGERQRQDDGR